jgi:RimJ/RimL family protein N-acetyltransferase
VVIFRSATPADLERVMALMVPDPAGGLTADTYRIRSLSRQYRPEWTWLAEGNATNGASDTGCDNAEGNAAENPAAAAVWWGEPRESRPSALDGMWVRESVPTADRAPLAGELLSRAHHAYAKDGNGAKDGNDATYKPPRYHLFLPGNWRDRPDAVEALEWREEAARRAGLTQRLERLRYEWTSGAGLPSLAGRLTFRAEPDDEVFADVMAQVLDGTLDATSREQAARVGPRLQARQDVTFYRDHMRGDRSWWRLAETPDGRTAGFGIPSRNVEYPVVGYLGVLPEQRGHGYVDEILAEITRILAAEAGATIIHADTDLENRPMAAAFERAGYRNFGRRLVLSAR